MKLNLTLKIIIGYIFYFLTRFSVDVLLIQCCCVASVVRGYFAHWFLDILLTNKQTQKQDQNNTSLVHRCIIQEFIKRCILLPLWLHHSLNFGFMIINSS